MTVFHCIVGELASSRHRRNLDFVSISQSSKSCQRTPSGHWYRDSSCILSQINQFPSLSLRNHPPALIHLHPYHTPTLSLLHVDHISLHLPVVQPPIILINDDLLPIRQTHLRFASDIDRHNVVHPSSNQKAAHQPNPKGDAE